jgi:drug/metabolite transporter (DMT)-like permease
MSSRRSGFLLVLLSAACFAFLPTTLRSIYASSDFKAIDAAVWRYLLAVPIILMVIALQRRFQPEKPDTHHRHVPLKHLLGLGVVFAAPVLLAFFGLERLPVGLFMLLVFTSPAIVALLSLFFGWRLSGTGWLALAFTLTGVALTIGNFGAVSGLDVIGVAFTVAQAVSIAVYYMLAAHVLADSNDNTRNTAWIMVGTLLTVLFLIPIFGLKMPQQLSTWLGLLVLGGVCTGLPIFALNAGIQRIGAAQAAIVGSVELVFSTLLAFFILGEPVLPLQIVGTILIITAVILLQTRPDSSARKRKPAAAAPSV